MALLLFLAIFLILLILIVWYSLWIGISPMPSSSKVQKVVLKELPSEVFGTIFELGSGWGNFAYSLAKKYPKAKVIAFEISPIPYLFSYLFYRKENLIFLRQDFFNSDLSEADLIFCYLYPAAMERLSRKFKKELRGGKLVVSHTFAIPDRKAERVIRVKDLYNSLIYFYRY